MSHNITVQGGTSVRLPTAGKYCDRDIFITATGGGVALPELTNEGEASDLMLGKELIDAEGAKVTGTFTLASELSEQDSLIAQIQQTLEGKVAGGGVPEYSRVGYIKFTGEQVADTGIVCTQDTKIRIVYTRDSDDAMYLYGVVNSGNTASVTAYLSGSGGTWRFGNKSAAATIATNEELVQCAIVSKTGFVRPHLTQNLSGINAFETIGSLILGAVRNADGTVASAQFVGKVYLMEIWQGTELVRQFVPHVTAAGVYGFLDAVSGEFQPSMTEVPFEGGNA